MESDNRSPRQTLDSILYQFGIGALLGLIFVCVPLAISMPGMATWSIAVSIVLFCGVLSALVGKRFLTVLMRVLESFPPIA